MGQVLGVKREWAMSNYKGQEKVRYIIMVSLEPRNDKRHKNVSMKHWPGLCPRSTLSSVDEATLLELQLRWGHKLLHGCVYRSPTSSDINKVAINKLICTICDASYSHVCLLVTLMLPISTGICRPHQDLTTHLNPNLYTPSKIVSCINMLISKPDFGELMPSHS